MSPQSSDYHRRLQKTDGYQRDIYTTSSELSLYYDPFVSETLRASALCAQQSMASRVVKVQDAEQRSNKKSEP